MAIETTPVGKFAKLSKIEAVKGAKQGLANIGESLSGTKAGQFVTSALKNSKGKATQLVDKMVEYGVRRTANVSQIAKEMPKRLLQTRYNLGVANRAVKDIAKRSVIGAYSEAVEEGLQQEQQYERMYNPSD
jgi:replicative DNA helicase